MCRSVASVLRRLCLPTLALILRTEHVIIRSCGMCFLVLAFALIRLDSSRPDDAVRPVEDLSSGLTVDVEAIVHSPTSV